MAIAFFTEIREILKSYLFLECPYINRHCILV